MPHVLALLLFLALAGSSFAHQGKRDPFGGHWDHGAMEYHCHGGECGVARAAGKVPYEPVPALLKRMREAGIDWHTRYGGDKGQSVAGTKRPKKPKATPKPKPDRVQPESSTAPSSP